MNMLKTSVAKALFAVTAVAVAGTAMAAENGANAATDLFAAVWNPATNVSVVEDLGSAWSFAQLNSTSTFNSEAGFTQTFTLDGGSLVSDLTAGTYKFAVFAGDLSQAVNCPPNGFCSYLGNVSMLSELSTLPGQAFPNTTAFDSGFGPASTYVGNNMPGTVTKFKNTTSSNYWDSGTNTTVPHGNFNIGGFQGSGSGTDALTLWKYVATSTSDNGQDPTTLSYIGNSAHHGLFTLNDATGVLSYNLAAAGVTGVPLPAAVWLLVSGLLGLGAVGRRKAAAAV
jgi:hypothetical protein